MDTSKLIKKHPNQLFLVVFLITLCALAANIYRDIDTLISIKNKNSVTDDALSQTEEKQTTVEKPSYSIQGILNANLMGKKKKIQDIIPDDLPETRLKLSLVGTFTDSLEGEASALISEEGKPSDRYFVGDTIPGGATLSAVRKSSVTLEREGKYEVLYYPHHKTYGQNTSTSRKRRNRQNSTTTYSNTAPSNDQLSLKQRLEKLRQQRQQHANKTQ